MIRSALKCNMWIALAALAVSGVADATPSVSQVVAAIDAGNMHSADVMLQDVIAAHPNSARAHFMEAQVLGKEGRAEDGLAQLHAAERLDPAFKFASGARVAKIEAELKAEVAALPAPTPREEPGRPDVNAEVRQPAHLVAAQPPYGAYAAVIVGLIVAVVVLLVVFVSARHRRKRAVAAEEQRRKLMRRMTSLLGTVREILLDSRLLANGAANVLAAEAEGLRGAVSEGLSMLSDSRPFPESAVEALEWRASDLRSRLEGRGPLPAPGANSRAADPTSPSGAASVDWRNTGHGSPMIYAPQTVYVDNSPDVITAMLLADALRPAPLIVERDVYVEPAPYLATTYRDEYVRDVPEPTASATRSDDDDLRWTAGGGGSDFDVGNGGNVWGNDGGGGIDAGSDGGWAGD